MHLSFGGSIPVSTLCKPPPDQFNLQSIATLHGPDQFPTEELLEGVVADGR
jgi:hypothetical protein